MPIRVELKGEFRNFKRFSTRIKREWGRIQRQGNEKRTYSTKPNRYPVEEVRAVYFWKPKRRYRGGYAEFRRNRGKQSAIHDYILTGRLFRNIHFRTRMGKRRLLMDVIVNDVPYYGMMKRTTTGKLFDIWFLQTGFARKILKSINWQKLLKTGGRMIRVVQTKVKNL